MDIRWDSYEDLPRYLATRIDPKTGPVKLSATAKRSRTIISLIEQASFIRTGKTGVIQICVCFEKLVYEEPAPLPSLSPLPNRTKVKEEPSLKTAKGKEKDKGEKATDQIRCPQPKTNASHGARKRAISQISSPQTRRPLPEEHLSPTKMHYMREFFPILNFQKKRKRVMRFLLRTLSLIIFGKVKGNKVYI